MQDECPASGREPVALLARLPLDRSAYSYLLASLGLTVELLSDAAAAGVSELPRDAPATLVIVGDDAEPGLPARIGALRSARPDLRIVVIGRDDAVTAWAGVADAVVSRRSGLDELRAALQSPPSPGPRQPRAARRGRGAALSRTEAELLPLLAAGLTLRDAARTLDISYKTADNSRTRLFRKLGLRDRVQLARFAIREGIISA